MLLLLLLMLLLSSSSSILSHTLTFLLSQLAELKC